MRNHCETKVFRIESDRGVCLLGGCGDEGDVIAVVEWVRKGRPDAERPKCEPDSFTGILIEASGRYRLDSKLYPLKLMEPFHAVGSGRDFAMAAMHLGRSAKEAVGLACYYDVYTSGTITEVSLEEGPR